MRKCIGLTLLTSLAGTLSAQGQEPPRDARLIEFDRARTVCLPKKAAAFDAASLRREDPISGQFKADAISLDQNWIRLEYGDDRVLVASAKLRFGSC